MTLLLYALAPVTLICLSALILVRTALRHHPSARYAACLLALTLALLSPLFVGLRQVTGLGWITVFLPQASSPSPNAPAPDAPQGADWPMIILLAVWTMGAAWGALRFFQGARLAARLRRSATPCTRGVPTETIAAVERALGRPLPPVFASPDVSSPVAVGVVAPVVILPSGLLETLSPLALRHVLLHESAHIALGHPLGGLVERAAGVLLWPHPLIRPLCRELARAREEVCDNVASQEAGAACYARTLLALAQGMPPAPNLASALALLGPETSLEARISGLLNPRRNRMIRTKQGKLWAVIGVAACALISTVAVRVAAKPAPKKQDNKPKVVQGFPIKVENVKRVAGQPIEVRGFPIDIGSAAKPKPEDDATAALDNATSKRDSETSAKDSATAAKDSAIAERDGWAAKRKAEAEAVALGKPAMGSQAKPTAGASAAEELAAKKNAEAKAR